MSSVVVYYTCIVSEHTECNTTGERERERGRDKQRVRQRDRRTERERERSWPVIITCHITQ